MMLLTVVQSGVVRSCGSAVAGASMSVSLPPSCHPLIVCCSSWEHSSETPTNSAPTSPPVSLVLLSRILKSLDVKNYGDLDCY